MTSSETVLLSSLAVDEDGKIFGGGALNGTATFNNQTEVTTTDGFDSFIGQLTPLIVNTVEEEILTSSIKIFPNPATEYIQIETILEDLEIRVFNVEGREILKTNERMINCLNWPSGAYFLKMNSGENFLLVKE